MRDRARLVLRASGALLVASAMVLPTYGSALLRSALPSAAGASDTGAATAAAAPTGADAGGSAAAPASPTEVSAVLTAYRRAGYSRVMIRRPTAHRVVATPAVVQRPVVVAPPAPVGNANDPKWQCIIRRESGGNPRAVNPYSGAGGLFQFLPSSWWAYGGTGLPQNASVAEQWRIALNAFARSGWAPWAGPGC